MKTVQKLVLFRRHGAGCHVNSLLIPAKRKRYFMKCDCPIWIMGRTPTGDIVPRQSTSTTDLRTAEAKRDAIIAGAAAVAPPDVAYGPTIAACIEKYVESRKHEIGTKTSGYYNLLLERLRVFCETQNATYMGNLTVDLLETFKTKGLPEMMDTSKGTAVAKLRAFLKTAYRRGWIKEPLALKITSHKSAYEQKKPYEGNEVERIFAESLNLTGRTGFGVYANRPKTFRLLLELMVETGMRVGDAVLFNPSTLVRGEHLWIYTYTPQKTRKTDDPKLIEAYLQDDLKVAIDKCHWLSPQLPFHYGASRNPSYLANQVYIHMQLIGERCGVKDCRPHRLRDTFAVTKLLAGVSLDDVSRLLGHANVKVTQKYYARWVTSRGRRLERIVAKSLVDPDDGTLRNPKRNVSSARARKLHDVRFA